ncbi:helix-turn-helix transcriptional regulator [Larsenimonas rhizosphaerae]|uniref:helix-turn-helix transcriptional regulator n=1 Tax=Larsenimonas rhizosphaerae TaxID=2944682 RepID=UPI003898F2A5
MSEEKEMLERCSDNPILRVGEGAKRLGISRKTLYNRWSQYKTFPPLTEYSPGVRGWRQSTLEDALRKLEQQH